MIGVILAAGKGSRLGGLTEEKPKSLLKLNNVQTLLDYNLKVLDDLGIKDIMIVVGFEADQIKEYVARNTRITCIYNPFWNKCNVLGSLYMALPYIQDDFLFLHADTLVDKKVWEEVFRNSGEIVLPYKSKKCGEEEMKIKLGANKEIIEINKIMDADMAEGEFLGIAKFSLSMVEFFQTKSEFLFKTGELNQYMEEVIQEAINIGKNIELIEIGEAKFVEVDFLEDYAFAKKLFSEMEK